MTPREVLIEARTRIEDPARWTKGAFAKHANGNAIGPQEPNAACWCIQGALRATKTSGRLREVANDMLIEQLPDGHQFTHVFNDDPSTKHEDVLALFDRAILVAP